LVQLLLQLGRQLLLHLLFQLLLLLVQLLLHLGLQLLLNLLLQLLLVRRRWWLSLRHWRRRWLRWCWWLRRRLWHCSRLWRRRGCLVALPLRVEQLGLLDHRWRCRLGLLRHCCCLRGSGCRSC
jgi:hypothetical protein